MGAGTQSFVLKPGFMYVYCTHWETRIGISVVTHSSTHVRTYKMVLQEVRVYYTRCVNDKGQPSGIGV